MDTINTSKDSRQLRQFSTDIIFRNTERTVYEHRASGDVVGYLTQADNLNVLVVRNAGHMVPLSQPVYAQQMIEEFTEGSMSK